MFNFSNKKEDYSGNGAYMAKAPPPGPPGGGVQMAPASRLPYGKAMGGQASPQFSSMRGMGGSSVPASAAFGGGGRPQSAMASNPSQFIGGRMGQSNRAGSAPRMNNMGQTTGHGTDVNAVQQARMQGPDPAAIQAEMKRREMGAGMGPGNAALAGYMMSK